MDTVESLTTTTDHEIADQDEDQGNIVELHSLLSSTTSTPDYAVPIKRKPKTKSVQVSTFVKCQNKGTAYKKLTKSPYYLLLIATQTEADPQIEMKTNGTQCNLLNTPPLQRLPPAVTSLEDSIATETETDLDASFCSLYQEDYTTE